MLGTGETALTPSPVDGGGVWFADAHPSLNGAGYVGQAPGQLTAVV